LITRSRNAEKGKELEKPNRLEIIEKSKARGKKFSVAFFTSQTIKEKIEFENWIV